MCGLLGGFAAHGIFTTDYADFMDYADGEIVVRVQRRGAAFYAALHK